MSLVHPQSPHREIKKRINKKREKKKEKKRKEQDGARGKYQKRAMDRTGGFPTGLLCWFIWRSAMGFHCQSIRFEGGGRVQVIGLKRTGKSCRLRWVNYLHPGLKRGKMTPQEERLVLELHSKWGNRWSRIARKLPGRTDNEIKNFWRTHMRKVAQEKKKAAVHHVVVSPSSSSTVDSVPTIEIGEESFYDTGGDRLDYLGQHKELLEEEDGKGYSYSMDDIWRDIDDQSVIKPVCNEQFCSSNFSCGPVVSPLWEYGQYSPWKVAEEDNKLFAAMNIYDHGEAVALT